jgi:hypothetical protein
MFGKFIRKVVLMFQRKPLFSSQKQNWQTPEIFYRELNKEFRFDFDPCPIDPQFDGLSVEWKGSNFVNPPYNQIAKWLLKGVEEWKKGRTIVFLIPSRTDTRWWHEYVMQANEIRFVKGRLKFGGAKNSAPFPSAIIVYKGRAIPPMTKVKGILALFL